MTFMKGSFGFRLAAGAAVPPKDAAAGAAPTVVVDFSGRRTLFAATRSV
ncbi:MAG TPA: hypothetical protein VIO94_10110 [Phenylobacterium sp.]